MADTGEKQSTSFRQFEYCPLCKVSHKKRKKHIYSKHHQQILKSIVKKFSVKIQAVKQDLFNPRVEESEFEFGAKFWCYFCQSEYLKHDVVELTTVIGAGLLEHIASEDHNANMVQFFWDNLLDKKLKPRFILSPEDWHISKKAAFLAVKKFQKMKSLERKKMAERLEVDEERYQYPAPVGQLTKDNPMCQPPSDRPSTSGDSSYRPATSQLRTLQASGPGLTSIIQKNDSSNDKEDVGNVHTGATPPWLQSDTPSNSNNEIGPTMTDYQKHLEKERKAKLPATRVGANFDHTSASTTDWLPSFGRVWGKGRRLQSKIHFEKEWKSSQRSKHVHTNKSTSASSTNPTLSSTTTTTDHDMDSANHGRSSMVDANSNLSRSDQIYVKPYKRKSKSNMDNNLINVDASIPRQRKLDYSISTTGYTDIEPTASNSYHYSHSNDLYTDNSATVAYKRNSDFSKTKTSFMDTDVTAAYKRKSEDVGCHDNSVVSYKKRSEVVIKATSSTQLIQTPLLADFK